MKQFYTHIIMVSGQPTPNVLPVMDKEVRPDNIILCTTADMRPNAEILVRYFQKRQFKTRIFELGDEYDLGALQDSFFELAAELDGERETVGVNLTGGTKLMIIAAQQIFGQDFTCFYVNPKKNLIQYITRQKIPAEPICGCLKIKDFFEIHGYQVLSCSNRREVSAQSRHLFEILLKEYNRYGEALKTLNYLAARAEKDQTLTVRNEIGEKNWDLLKLFMDHGAVAYYDDREIRFASVEFRRFCGGFWLEDWVWLAMTELAKKLRLEDFASSILIRSAGGVQNEIDAAFLHDNRLYLIECKTAGLDAAERSAAPLYKLDTLHKLPGIFTQAILVSYFALDPAGKQRANDLNIRVIEKGEILGLSTHFANLLPGGK